MLLSVAVEQSLLADADNVDALLDELTAYECDGFYVLLEIDPQTDPAQAAVHVERGLYITHTLSKINDYTVWAGYAGLNGYVYRAAGATVSAGGWWQKQNTWATGNWSASGGGRQPHPRIYLESLLGSLRIDVELERIVRQRSDPGLATDVLSGAGLLAQDFLNGRVFDGNYDRPEMTAQLFSVCRALDRRVTGNTQTDIRRTFDDAVAAEEL